MNSMKLGESLWMIHLNHMRTLDQIVDASRTRGENGMLLYLYHVGHPVFPGELTEKLGLTTGRIANILKMLEKSELILRTQDALDRRRVLVALTEKGEALAEERNQRAMEFHARLISHLSQEEAERFLATLERVFAFIEEEPDIRS